MNLRAPGPKPILLRATRPNEGVRLAYQRQLEKLVTALQTSLVYWLSAEWRKLGLPTEKALAQDGDVEGHEFHGNQYTEGITAQQDKLDKVMVKSLTERAIIATPPDVPDEPVTCHEAIHNFEKIVNQGPDVAGFKDRTTIGQWDETKWDAIGKDLAEHPLASEKKNIEVKHLMDDIRDGSVNGHSFAIIGNHTVDPHLASRGVPQRVINETGRELRELYEKHGMMRKLDRTIKDHALLQDAPKGLTPEQLKQLKLILSRLGVRWEKTFQAAANDLARKFAASALRGHDTAFGDSLRRAGFSVKLQTTPAIDEALRAIYQQNVELIHSIPAEHLAAVQELIQDSVESGRSLKEVTHLLRDRYDITLRRAALIARDQNNKATATIHKTRQKEVGITHAQWIHTSASVHPREEHEGWDGQPYPIDTGMYSEEDGEFVWPGTPINCGCTCLSIVPGSTDEEEEAA